MSQFIVGDFEVSVSKGGWPIWASVHATQGVTSLTYLQLCDLQYAVQRALAEMRPAYEQGGGGSLRQNG